MFAGVTLLQLIQGYPPFPVIRIRCYKVPGGQQIFFLYILFIGVRRDSVGVYQWLIHFHTVSGFPSILE